MSSSLLSKKCVPCEGGTDPLKTEEIVELQKQVPEWKVADDEKSIWREFKFQDFVTAIVFITDVAHIAEEEGHHPALNLHHYKFLKITMTTDAIQGLSENDFILAAKIDALHNDESEV